MLKMTIYTVSLDVQGKQCVTLVQYEKLNKQTVHPVQPCLAVHLALWSWTVGLRTDSLLLYSPADSSAWGQIADI
jgi:hypothetical protein